MIIHPDSIPSRGTHQEIVNRSIWIKEMEDMDTSSKLSLETCYTIVKWKHHRGGLIVEFLEDDVSFDKVDKKYLPIAMRIKAANFTRPLKTIDEIVQNEKKKSKRY